MIQTENFQTILFSTSSESKSTQKIYGVHRMSTELRLHGFTCQVVHFYAAFTNAELQKLAQRLVGDKTLVVGFSSTFFAWASEKDQEEIIRKSNLLIDYIQLTNPKVKIIVGGAGPFTMINNRNNCLKRVSAVFDGFPEHLVCKYVSALYEGTELPQPTKFKFDSISVYIPNDDDFDFSKSQIIYAPEDYIDQNESVVIEVARGCIFKCKFCTFRLNGKKKLDYIKDPEVLREELIRNYNDYKIQYYILSDDTFNDSTEKIRLLHQVFTTLPFKIKFSTYLRLDLLYHNREQVHLLKEMGLVGAMFGVETFHYGAAKAVGKGLDGTRSKKFLDELKNKYWGDGIKIEVALITGLPCETLESYEETKKWILDQSVNVDLIRVNALGLSNPNISYKKSGASLFAQNAHLYGYYWKDDSNFWYNDDSEVKDFQQAMDIRQELDQAARRSFKFAHGGFTLFCLWTELQKTNISKVTFDDLLNMSRVDFTNWTKRFVSPNKEKLRQNYLNHYKKNFGL